jgi:ATP-dependent DNA helicase RecG
VALPINIHDLINGQVVEWERIEFKAGWNDLDILHTICAFANDFGNLGGGYIIIGIDEKAGRPILPLKGLQPSEADKIQKELLNLCKQRISKEYSPYVEPVTYEKKLILVIWCPGGQERPYEAPESFTKGAIRHYFIRRFNNTVKPNKTEREELLRFSAIPYDDRTNHHYTINDLSPGLIRSFLQEIKSKLFDEFDKTSFLDICRQMNLVVGPDEYIKPKNYALMFFNDHPEKIFPNAQIELINFQTSDTDSAFTETIFDGPIHIQLKEALKYFKFQVIKERVNKVPYQAEAIRYFNFPYEALEEVLANAVYHRNYEINEPIEVRIHPDRIHIISFPGPDPFIKMEDMETGKVLIRRYRNRQIGNILKELKLTEGKCTGIPLILRSMKKNGSPKPFFESDDSRQALMVTLPAHESFIPVESTSMNESKMPYVSKKALQTMLICSVKPLSKKEIGEQLNLSTGSGYLKKLLIQLIANKLLEYTIPAKPNSPLQKYRTTALGYGYLGS